MIIKIATIKEIMVSMLYTEYCTGNYI